VLLGIGGIARSATGYDVQIDYVPAATAESACQAKNFAGAPETKTSLPLSWDGSTAKISTPLNFAPSS
jgi:hypothetical protein